MNTSSGNTGNIFVNVENSFLMSGTTLAPSIDTQSLTSQIITRSQGRGNAGAIEVASKNLKLLNGASIASAANFGIGKGGNVEVHVEDSIELVGIDPISFFSSVIGVPNVAGGGAGTLTMTANKISLKDGGRIDTATFGNSDAGKLTVVAREFIDIDGTAPGSINPSLIDSTANLVDSPILQIFGIEASALTGNAGDLTIQAPLISIRNGAVLTTRNDGSGDAGNLEIIVDQIFLDNGSITALTQSGIGGNIDIKVKDLITLSQSSIISAEAGGIGNGGNINIEPQSSTPLILLSTPDGNNDIIANAFEGQGGQINISASALIGFQERSRRELEKLVQEGELIELNPILLSSNDISAISQQGGASLDGDINFLTPTSDPSSLLAILPDIDSAPKRFIKATCYNPGDKIDKNSYFTQIGRDNVENNDITLSSNIFSNNWISHSTFSPSKQSPQKSIDENHLALDDLPSEANGWKRQKNGSIEILLDRNVLKDDSKFYALKTKNTSCTSS